MKTNQQVILISNPTRNIPSTRLHVDTKGRRAVIMVKGYGLLLSTCGANDLPVQHSVSVIKTQGVLSTNQRSHSFPRRFRNWFQKWYYDQKTEHKTLMLHTP